MRIEEADLMIWFVGAAFQIAAIFFGFAHEGYAAAASWIGGTIVAFNSRRLAEMLSNR